jgi:hypothetical protein
LTTNVPTIKTTSRPNAMLIDDSFNLIVFRSFFKLNFLIVIHPSFFRAEDICINLA